MRINNQIFITFIEEETPSAKGNMCKCSYNGFGSSDSVSSLETYVEETELSVNSREEEVGQSDEGVRRSKGEENEGDDGEGGDQATQTTKKLGFEESPTKGILSQIKVGESFTNKGMKVQKVLEEIIFVNPSGCVVDNVEGNS